MRKRRIAYNEYVDEFGNVRRKPGDNYTVPRYREHSGSSAVADLGVAFFRLIWWIIKAIARGFGYLLQNGARKLSDEWDKPKPIIPNKYQKRR